MRNLDEEELFGAWFATVPVNELAVGVVGSFKENSAFHILSVL
jgi:hypothetical protein